MADVVVVGAGRMGSQIGTEYARAGHRVTFLVRSRGRAGAAPAVESADEIATAPELVVESLPEDLELKASVVRPLLARWPEAIFATNTSSLEIGALGAAAGAPERTIGTHYWNPPLLMPLVEVIAGPETAPAVVERVVALLEAIGKRPIRVRRDVPGFIWNRLQFALLREALWLLDAGVASAEDIDEVVRDGLARRLRLTGPFETAELGGLETFAQVAENLFPVLSNATDAPRLREWTPRDEAELAALARRRDAALARELR
jgi:3-hydroxybutyryl-CoA dehydrogenase